MVLWNKNKKKQLTLQISFSTESKVDGQTEHPTLPFSRACLVQESVGILFLEWNDSPDEKLHKNILYNIICSTVRWLLYASRVKIEIPGYIIFSILKNKQDRP